MPDDDTAGHGPAGRKPWHLGTIAVGAALAGDAWATGIGGTAGPPKAATFPSSVDATYDAAAPGRAESGEPRPEAFESPGVRGSLDRGFEWRPESGDVSRAPPFPRSAEPTSGPTWG